MELTANKISYAIALNDSQWKKLDAADYDEVEKVWLKGTKAKELEWSGHFGSNFFFSIQGYSVDEMNTEAQKVVSVIQEHLGSTPKRKLKK